MLRRDPAWQDYAAITGVYLYYAAKFRNDNQEEADKDRTLLKEFLAKWEQQLPGVYVFDVLRGLEAYSRDDNVAAQNFYQRAINKNPPTFEVYEELIQVRLDSLDETVKDDDLKHLLDPVFDFVQRQPTSPDPHILLGKLALLAINAPKSKQFYSKIFTTKPDYQSAQASFRKAFELKPTEENAILYYDELMNYSQRQWNQKTATEFQQRAYENLLAISSELPKSRLVFELLARHVSTYLGNEEPATRFYEKAIENSETSTDRTKNVIDFGESVYDELSFDYDKAERTYLAELQKGGDKVSLLFALYLNSRNAQNFTRASKYLDELEAYNRANLKDELLDGAILDRRRQINTFASAANQAEAFYKDNPFLKAWQEMIGSQSLTIHYNSGSAAISEKDFPLLARAANLLKEPAGSKYILAIEGHSDNTDADRVLSQQRAEAVQRYLHDQHGIEFKRLQPEGFGADFPIASNQTEAGRGKNRRVEILPVGSISKPRISATAAMNADRVLAISPDGRTLAVGRNPIQLWDIRENTKIKDLGRGGWLHKFSPNGRYLATTLNYAEVGGFVTSALVVYDIKTGLVDSQVPWGSEVTDLDWDPQSQKIVYSVEPNHIVIYDLAQHRNVKQRISPGPMMNAGDIVLWTKDGKYIVGARASARELQVYDAQTLELVKELPGVVWPHALAQTSDQQYLICTGQSDLESIRKLTIWKTSDWSMRQMDIPALANNLAMHPAKHTVALNDFGCSASVDNQRCTHITALVDLDNMAVIATRPAGGTAVTNAFSGDGSKLYQAFDERIEVLDAASKKLESTATILGTSVRPNASAADIVNGYFLSADANGIHVWNVSTGKKVHTWKRPVKLFDRFGDGSDTFVGASENTTKGETELWTFNTSKLEEKLILTLNFKVDCIARTPSVIVVGGKKFLADNQGADKGIIEVYEAQTLKLRKRFEVGLVLGPLRYQSVEDSGITALAVNPSGTQVSISTYWQDGFGHPRSLSTLTCPYDVSSGQRLSCIQLPDGVREIAYKQGSDTMLEITTRLRTYVYDLPANKYAGHQRRRANEKRIALSSGAEVLWAGDYIKYASPAMNEPIELYFKGDLVGVAVFEKNNLLLTLNNANEISFYNLATGQQELTILSKNNNEWIAYAPTGEFISSEHGAEKVFWSLGDRYLEFSALRESFESRDVILRKLDAISKRTNSGSSIAPDLSDSLAGLYKVDVVSPKDSNTSDSQYELILKVESKQPSAQPPQFSFSHQNQNVKSTEGTQITYDGETKTYTVKRVFDLAENENYIQVFLNIGKARIYQDQIHINKVNSQHADDQVTLWFLGLAVESYKNREDSLLFPVADVTKIKNALEKQAGPTKVYKRVDPKILTQNEVNRTNIESELRRMKRDAGPNDVFILYISGHGVLNDSQNIVLMPAGSDLKDANDGIDMVPFYRFLANKKAAQKTIIFLDICHASALRDDPIHRSVVTTADIQAVLRGTGAAVFCSTDGKAAKEGTPPAYQNGYFAKAILEAMEGTSQPVLGQTRGKILTLELMNYVNERVYAETGREQQPTILFLENVGNQPFAVCPLAKPPSSVN